MGRMYSVSFTDVAVTADQDFFQIEAKGGPVIIHYVEIGQNSDVGDSAAESLTIIIQKITDDITDAATDVPIDSGTNVSLADIVVNDTTPLTTGAVTLHASVWNIAMPWIYMPTPEMRPVIEVDNALTVTLVADPADSLTVSGTMYFEEIG